MENKVFPTQEELSARQQATKEKIAEVNKAKAQAVAEKINQLDSNLVSINELYVYLADAEKNLAFYQELEENQQLLPEDTDKFEEAQKLVAQVRDLIDKKMEESKSLMQISEVNGEVRKMADSEENKRKKEKMAKEFEAKVVEWINDFTKEIEEINRLIQEKSVLLGESENKVEILLKEKFGNAHGYDAESRSLRKDLEKEKVGLFNFSKRGSIKEVLKSSELANLEKCQNDSEALKEEIKFSGGNSIIRYVFENKGAIKDRFDILNSLVEEDKNFDLHYILYKKIEESGKEGRYIKDFLRDYDKEKK